MNGLVRDYGWNIVEVETTLEVVGPCRQPADHNEDQRGGQDEQVIPWFLASRRNRMIISASIRTTLLLILTQDLAQNRDARGRGRGVRKRLDVCVDVRQIRVRKDLG
jgi:hypothetical protein